MSMMRRNNFLSNQLVENKSDTEYFQGCVSIHLTLRNIKFQVINLGMVPVNILLIMTSG